MIEIDVRGTVADGPAVLAAFVTAAKAGPRTGDAHTWLHHWHPVRRRLHRAAIVTATFLPGRENTLSRTNTFTRVADMNLNRRKMITLGAALAATGGLAATASPSSAAIGPKLPSDAELAASLPGGFRSAYAYVNGIRLHYVTGGAGEPLVLLPGWPATWWSYHKVMPALARRYRMIAIDIRGMGASDKPAGGFDKKTMARDVYELVRKLGHDRVNIAGHDIGAMVAFSFAPPPTKAPRSSPSPSTPSAGRACWSGRSPTWSGPGYAEPHMRASN
jgi:hypothetical protein